MSLLSMYKAKLCEVVSANDEIEDDGKAGIIIGDRYTNLLQPTEDSDFMKTVESFQIIQKSVLARQLQTASNIKTHRDLSQRASLTSRESLLFAFGGPLQFGNENQQASVTAYPHCGSIFAANVVLGNTRQFTKKRKVDAWSRIESSLRRIRLRAERELQEFRAEVLSWEEKENKWGQAFLDQLYSRQLRERLLIIFIDAVDRQLDMI